MSQSYKPNSRLAGLFAVLGALTPSHGDITYTLQFDPNASNEARQVADSVTVAAATYNQYGSFNKHWSAYHNPGIPTAEANYDGYMGFGGIRNERVVFHEASHTFGMGTHGNYGGLIAGGVWRGYWGNKAEVETYLANGDGGYGDGLHGDGHAVWPGGFNYDDEDGFLRRLWHIRIMSGLRADLGILSVTSEARNEFAHIGGTAEFSVESPRAASYQWTRNGLALTNGGDIAGANSRVLRISNIAGADAGTYRCTVTGAGETLASRTRELTVDNKRQILRMTMQGNVRDSSGKNFHSTATGTPAFVSGKSGLAVDLDGVDDSIELPAGAVLTKDFTIAAWVNWDGGGDWQRVFDFGTGVDQNLFLTPKAGGGSMRLSFKDAINGLNREYQVNVPALPTGQWVHLAAVREGNTMTLYMNGVPVGSNAGLIHSLHDFAPDRNYIGKSQYPDPLFNGRIDDFLVYNYALSGANVWQLGSSLANAAPIFLADPIVLPTATMARPYTGQNLTAWASDADGSSLTFTKISGPSWVTVAANGNISGTPAISGPDQAPLVVRVSDSTGASSDAEVVIPVTGTVAHWNFEEGTDGTTVPYGQTGSGRFDGSIIDVSGNGNPLSVWDNNWYAYRSEVPAATTPQTGRANLRSLQNANAFPGLTAIGTALTNWSPEAWTLEAAIRPDDATNGYQTIIGRDSQGLFGGDYALAALYLQIIPDGNLRILFIDRAGNNWSVTSPANTIQDGKWQAIAATSDGDTLSLYLKNITNGDSGYQLLGSLDISASTNPALSTGAGDGGDWDHGVFTVARGLYNGGHTDRFYGHLDDIRFTQGALTPAELLHSLPFTPAELWRQAHFSSTANTGDAADGSDPDGDGTVNLLERVFGGDPNVPDREILPAIDPAGGFFSLVYSKSLAATDLTLIVEESADLVNWDPATGSETTLSNNGTVRKIRHTRPPGDDDRLFLRVRVE